jgi:hypothetical protein
MVSFKPDKEGSKKPPSFMGKLTPLYGKVLHTLWGREAEKCEIWDWVGLTNCQHMGLFLYLAANIPGRSEPGRYHCPLSLICDTPLPLILFSILVIPLLVIVHHRTNI